MTDGCIKAADYIQMQPEGSVTEHRKVTVKVTKMQKEETKMARSFI